MKIRNIKSFKVFDLVHWKSNGVHTLVSLDLDGRRYYSIVLDGIRDVPSSEDVTVAFQDDEENSVLAWTDQKSREFFPCRRKQLASRMFLCLYLHRVASGEIHRYFGDGDTIFRRRVCRRIAFYLHPGHRNVYAAPSTRICNTV